jgi:HSP20 family molecular chaperone IbpA
MSDKDNQKPNGFIWNQVEKMINDRLSAYLNSAERSDILGKPAWVENYVQKFLSKALPSAVGSTGNGGGRVSFEVFETHDHVIAKIKLPAKENPRALQVFVRSDRIKLVGLLNGKSEHIPLPAQVAPKTAKARFKNGVLQVQVRKRRSKEPYHEVYVGF